MINTTKPIGQSERIFPFVSLILCLAFTNMLWADEDENSAADPEYAGFGASVCLGCHGETSAKPAHEILLTPMARKADSRTPFAEGGHQCETCHGPSKSHILGGAGGERPSPAVVFNASTPSEEQNEVCLECHSTGESKHWLGSTHDVEGVTCAGCHRVHEANDPILAPESQAEVCFSCHKDKRAKFLRQSRHPVQTSSAAVSHGDLMSCTDCHEPMGGSGPANLERDTVNETCYDCHAEKRGPFLWEHAPVREDCSNCHDPHGSNNPDLLLTRQPWLCQQCHAANFHPSGVYSGTGIPENGRADQRILGKQCLNCHQQIHGSNHPSGARLT